MSKADSLAKQYRIAYAKQAKADLAARRTLAADKNLPECQHLHMLQMACEKLCKAHLCGSGTNPDDLRTSHAYIAGPLPVIARQQFAVKSLAQPRDREWALPAIKRLARRIELLAPAVDDGGGAPANCEYPWVGPDGVVHAPADHDFGFGLLHEPAGKLLLKVLDAAADDLMNADG